MQSRSTWLILGLLLLIGFKQSGAQYNRVWAFGSGAGIDGGTNNWEGGADNVEGNWCFLWYSIVDMQLEHGLGDVRADRKGILTRNRV